MLELILIVALILLLVTVLVAALRRHDANNYFDQDRQPFYAEPTALVSAGLLFSQRDRDRKEQHTYTLTPAGEAGLRAWLREPTNDPGFLESNFAGLVREHDVDRTVELRSTLHRSRLAEYERLEQLFVNRPEWRYALAATRVGIRFERECLDFWAGVRAEGRVGQNPSDEAENRARAASSLSDQRAADGTSKGDR